MNNNVKRLREKQGTTQTALAISAQVQQCSLSLIERGQRCRPKTAKRIADALEMELGDVFPEFKKERT